MAYSDTVEAELPPVLAALQQLIAVVAQLRSPDGGCPWDLAQTPQTLIPYVIEEAYEVVDAIRQENPEAIADELGDLLLQVVLQAQIASESQQFDLATVADTITQKLIRRHPHVFGDVTVAHMDEVHQNWEQIKAQEDQESHGTDKLAPRLSRYARSLPPLTASLKISKKAAAAGFEWETVDGVWEKFQEELGEFKEAIAHESPARQQEELGDLLFTIVNLARWHGLDPDEALQSTNQRFIQRLTLMESVADRSLSDYSLDQLEELWQKAKQTLKKAES
ncbi:MULTISPECIES: nucleoside triphosphate pyrophosphohydrolase [unclassified Leptolyngbya]|uniref:nucleoside triphosphate pyrophosphohydrolase n=1 Tax=unclassified Leptolyngbya TaxID=2650499 RepID=UPI001684721B|nr:MULTISPECIES: nucleoside triphosphate pyrophosphohydrolase [unclassified Leptolyngbya]MBD1912514.1 nucleoside triphosphate pyrophosphohydrolase [Leptolyngbya sp. FACHB-8]MBD2156475.1 nucleoside triphosphate pyrophosphohydrolase [Leptolyngbya sp. FACHB-16]